MKLQKLISTNFIFSNSKVLLYKKDQTLLVKGPLGVVFLTLPVGFEVNWVDSCSVYLNSVSKSTILLQKTYSQLLVQKIRGVTVGFFEILIIHGVGWRLSVNQQDLTFSLGFSHLISYKVKAGIEITLLDSTNQRFKVFGLDFAEVRQVVVDLSRLRLLNPYTGKGVYKDGQIITVKTSSKSRS